MARIALTCECGWTFFLPGSTPGCEVACPSCSRSVAIPGRKPGDRVLSPGEIAAKVQRRAAAVRTLLVLVGLAVAAGAAALALRKPAPIAGEPEGPPARAEVRPRLPQGSGEPAERRPMPSASKIPQLRRRVLENVWQVNLASIVSECLRLRNLAREWSQVQETIAALQGRIKADQEELGAAKEAPALEPCFAEGDRIVAFGRRDFSVLRRADAARILHRWLNGWRAGAAVEQVQVLREERRLTLYLQFPEETRELLQLLRHPDLLLEPAADREALMAAPGTPPAERAAELIAIEVCDQTQDFAEIISEMRRRMEPLTTLIVPVWPDESVQGIALIGNPLGFRPAELPAATTQALAKWWGALNREERTRFATYFGLWCAHTRGQAAPK